MKIDKSEQLFLVLVPHRDTRLVLRNYSAELFKVGITGAFPWVAPLAAIPRPLNSRELKNIAHTFRKSAPGGKFRAEGACTMPFPFMEEKNSFLFGPCLDLKIPSGFLNGIGGSFSQAVIGACLLSGGEDGDALPCPPKLSFSAAALANMFWQPVSFCARRAEPDAAGYKWKIGKLCWLPKKYGADFTAQSKTC